MYSLLVSYQATEKTHGTFTVERDRFLEYTEAKIQDPLRSLSNEAIDCFRSWPCLLMEEGRADETARIVEITQIVAGKKDITVTLRPLTPPLEIANNELWKIRTELDLAQFEFSRNHWAVKERDLFAVLEKSGVAIPAGMRERFAARPMPLFSRRDLLKARDAIAAFSHDEIDDLLKEVGIRTLHAGRDLGSRKSRADAILDFALEHTEAVTAENSLLSQFLLQKIRSEAKTTNENNAPRVTPKPAPAKPKPAAVALAESVSRSPNRVFVVHGHNEKARSEVIAYLASLGLEGVVLHEQPNMGRHLLTKFLEEARLVTFAVVLMTDDDLGSAKDGKPLPRARQNVILELGYFIAYLGQAKVCALITPGLETPSDFDGIAYIKMAEDEKWKAELLRELRAAEMPLLPPTKK